MRIVFFSLL